jgi:hypothetical protein
MTLRSTAQLGPYSTAPVNLFALDRLTVAEGARKVET